MNVAVADPVLPVPFRDALRFWWKLGWISFGGPAGQIAILHEEVVERRRWLSERRFLHALDYCMVLPGPEAQQLATYVGWLLHGTRGGLVAGILFVLPAALLLTALSWLYLAFGHVATVDGVLFGFRPAVVAVILAAVVRLGRRTLRSLFGAALAAGAFAALELRVPFPAIVLGAAIAGALGARLRVPGAAGRGHGAGTVAPAARDDAVHGDTTPPPPHATPSAGRLLRVLAAGGLAFALVYVPLRVVPGVPAVAADLALFFTGAAFVTFGGAYAVLPHVAHVAVDERRWLTPTQMLDGLALGETTPGPLILVVTFVGYLAAARGLGPQAGALGAFVATWCTFVPSLVLVLAGAPFVEAGRERTFLAAPFAAVSAAVVGVIAHLARDLAPVVLWPDGRPAGLPIAIAAVSAGLLVLRRLSVPAVVLGAGLVGALAGGLR